LQGINFARNAYFYSPQTDYVVSITVSLATVLGLLYARVIVSSVEHLG